MLIEKIDTFSGHRDCVYTLEASNRAEICFSAGADGLVVEWNLAKPDIGKLLARVPSSVYAMRFHTASKQLWIGQNYEGIHVIDIESRQIVKSMKLSKALIFDIQFHENFAFVAGGDGVISVIDIENWSFKKHLKVAETSVRSITINPKKKEFAGGFSDNYIRVFSLDDFSLKHSFEAHYNSVFCVRYSPDFSLLFSGSRDAHLKIWDVDKKYELKQDIIAHTFAINDIGFEKNGTIFATCSMDKSIKLWQTENGKLLKVLDRARYAGHGTSINRLLWSSFDNQLLACSDDKTISVWKIIADIT